MNKKAILGVSLGAVFAIGMIMSPAFAGVESTGFLTGGLLKDHDEGKHPANNPAHYDLKVKSPGNYTLFAVMQTSSITDAVGFGLINETAYVHAFTSHSFDDCTPGAPACGNYAPHGHGGQLVIPGATECANAGANAELTEVTNLGKAKVKVQGDESSIELKGIPADSEVGLLKQVCNVDEVDDVADVTAFDIRAIGGHLCVFVDGPRSTTVDGANGPDNRNRDGGFDTTGPSADVFCPVPVITPP